MKTKSTSEATNSDPDIDALRPMTISKFATPVEGYDGGLGVAGVEGGVHFRVNPWLHMEEGDEFKVYWADGTVPVWSKTIELEDENQIVKGVIDEGHIRRGGCLSRVLQCDPREPGTGGVAASEGSGQTGSPGRFR